MWLIVHQIFKICLEMDVRINVEIDSSAKTDKTY